MKKHLFVAVWLFGLFSASHLWGMSGQGRTVNSPDDTKYLQSLLDKKGEIKLEQGRKYLVSGTPGEKSALYISSNTSLDMNGATIALSSREPKTLLGYNRKESKAQNISIKNGFFYGGSVKQPSTFQSEIGITPTLYFRDIYNLELENIKLIDTYVYAIYVQGNKGRLNNIYIQDAKGGGIHIDGENWKIGNIEIKNVAYFDKVNAQGNPFKVSIKNSTIDQLYCENYAFGIKFQNGSSNIQVNQITAKAGPLNREYMLKIQGGSKEYVNRSNQNISFKNVELLDGPNVGLYIYDSFDIEFERYRGTNNGSGNSLDSKALSDILIVKSGNIHFEVLESDRVNKRSLWLHNGSSNVSINTFSEDGVKADPRNKAVTKSGNIIAGSHFREL